MSTISEMSDSNLQKVVDKLILYEKMIDDSKKCFELDGRNLEDACKKQSQNLMMYDVAFQECKTIQDLVETHRDVIKSNHWKRLNEKHAKSLTTRDIEAYIMGESDWVKMTELVLEVVETRRKLEAIVEALKSLGWSLSHIVKLRVAQLEHITL
jgi:hypothetical protein